MSANTIEDNRDRHNLQAMDEIWLFGYGSLLYKIDFPILEQRKASIQDWARRFWQGSHDHRGTPDAPGRVLTLIEQAGSICQGLAFRVEPQVFEHLDHREKNGYLRQLVTLNFEDGRQQQGLLYVADRTNAAWAGEASTAQIASQIKKSIGPSGRNDEYVLKLATALRELRYVDEHVFSIEQALLSL
ncbi:MAG: gamma-glutamylcyclotransferase [Pseudomonadales bacterium]